MQTFLPYESYKTSAACLDNRRLGKQRVEVWQIYRALAGITKGWRNHPAAKMWAGYEWQLLQYGMACCEEWLGRGYKDTMLENMREAQATLPYCLEPLWISETELCLSHQSNLLRKMPEHYRPIFGDEIPDDLPYIWPSKLAIYSEKSIPKE
jgi:hypothetical protein